MLQQFSYWLGWGRIYTLLVNDVHCLSTAMGPQQMCQELWQGVLDSAQATINTNAWHASIQVTLVYVKSLLIVLCGLQVDSTMAHGHLASIKTAEMFSHWWRLLHWLLAPIEAIALLVCNVQLSCRLMPGMACSCWWLCTHNLTHQLEESFLMPTCMQATACMLNMTILGTTSCSSPHEEHDAVALCSRPVSSHIPNAIVTATHHVL